MRRTRRLLYTPYIISLIGLIITLPHFYKSHTPIKEYYLPLFMPNENNSSYYDFSKFRLEKDISRKKKLEFHLDDNRTTNKRKMEMIRYEALKLKYTEDNSTIVLINLSDNITYGDFISILDMCVADEHQRYASWDNKFVIFGELPKRKIKNADTLRSFSDYIPFNKIERKPSFAQLFVKNVKKYYTPQGLYLFLGFFVLLGSFILSRNLKDNPINTAKTPN